MSSVISSVSGKGQFFTAKRGALAGKVGPLLWFGILLLLDIIQFRYLVSIGSNPLKTAPASENAGGPIGFIYVLSDFTFGTLMVVFALGLRRAVNDSIWAKIGFFSLLAFGLGFVFGSAPCECAPGQTVGLSGTIHNIASLILLFATFPMTLFMGIAFRSDPRWQSYAWYSILTGFLAPVLFFVVNALPANFSWFYLWLILIPLLWTEVIANHLKRVAETVV